MRHRGWHLRLKDILAAARRIQTYTKDVDFNGFAADSRTVDAVVHNFSIIGEAARHVPTYVMDRHPGIPWRSMRDMRNILVHAYFAVDLEIVWDSVRNDLAPLIDALEAVMDSQDGNNDPDRRC